MKLIVRRPWIDTSWYRFTWGSATGNSVMFLLFILLLKYCMCAFTKPSAQAGCDKVNFLSSLTGLNSEFFFSKTNNHTKVKELSLPYYIPIAGGRIVGFMPFPRVLAVCEMKKSHPGFEFLLLYPFPASSSSSAEDFINRIIVLLFHFLGLV